MFKKYFQFLLFFVSIQSATAQRLLTTQFNNQEGSGGSKDYSDGWTMTNIAGTYRLIASADGSGDNFFRFRNTSSTDRSPATNGDVFPLTSTATPYSGNFFDGASNAFKITVADTSYRYVFKVDAGFTKGCIFEIQGSSIRSVSTVSRSPSGTVFPGQTVTVTATLDGSFHTGQAAYLRYSTNSFASSTIVKMSGSGTSYTAEIPASANTASANVVYYIFTSGDVSGTIAHGDADLYAINLNNNGGSNYSYTVASSWTTAADGNWNSTSTWTAGSVPPSNQPVTLNHNITVASDITQTSTISISSGKTLIVNAGQTLAVGGVVSGAGAVSVSGTLQINSGGFLSIAPTYADGSTLVYNSGGSYTASTEWTANAASGTGVPYHVQIGTSGLNNSALSFGTSSQYRRCRGNLTVGAASGSGYGLTLSTNLGGDLQIGGNYTLQNASVTNNGRAVNFNGNGTQTVSTTASDVFFDYLILDKASGSVVLDDNVTINTTSGNVLQLLGSSVLDLNGKTLNLNNNGGNILASGSGSKTITSTPTGGLVNINADKTISASGGGTLIFGSNVTVALVNSGTGLNFGSGVTTLNGVLQINTGTFVDTNSPTYGVGSTLLYNLTGSYDRTTEWNSSSLYHVTVQGSFTLNLGINSITSLSMAGNLTIASGSTVTMNSLAVPLQVAGQIENNGTLSLSSAIGGDLDLKGGFIHNGTLNCNDREIRFTGTSPQIISGSASSMVIDFFRCNNAAGLTLNRKVIVDNELRLDNGIITTSGANPIEIRHNATSTSGSASSFVSGPMSKIGNLPASFVFPIGKSTTWARLGINISGSSTTDVFTAEYFNSGAPNAASLSAELKRVSAIEHWTLDRSGSTNNASVTLYWQNASASGIDDSVSLRVCRYNGSNWVSEGQSSISYGSSGSITSNSISSFSPFSFGSTEVDNNPLPITLLGFWGQAQPDFNLLNWQVTNALYFSHFELQRYEEPTKSFSTIAKIAYSSENSYQWQDYGFEEVSYYRLKMVDDDSAENFSKTIAVSRPAFAQSEKILSIAPNPVPSGKLRFVYWASASGYREFVVWDMLGKEAYRFGINVSTGQNQLSIPTNLPVGVYLLESLSHGQSEKFIISHP
jgi:hypothetical protein